MWKIKLMTNDCVFNDYFYLKIQPIEKQFIY